MYKDNAFIGLSYSDEHLVFTEGGLPTLDPDHHKNWMKRFRTALAPHRIRFYSAGEYGDESQRPHYHAAVFNFPTCSRGRTLRRPESGTRPLAWLCCASCKLVHTTWGKGDVDLGTLGTESAQYISGYVVKKLNANHPDLDGRYPEFSRKSNRPGVGQAMMHEVASELLRLGLVDAEGDVPSALRHGSRLFPLGRYLRGQLRLMVGLEKNAPESTINKIKEDMQTLLDASKYGEALRKGAGQNHRLFVKNAILEAADQKVLNSETKQRIHRKVRTL